MVRKAATFAVTVNMSVLLAESESITGTLSKI